MMILPSKKKMENDEMQKKIFKFVWSSIYQDYHQHHHCCIYHLLKALEIDCITKLLSSSSFNNQSLFKKKRKKIIIEFSNGLFNVERNDKINLNSFLEATCTKNIATLSSSMREINVDMTNIQKKTNKLSIR